MRAIVHLAFVGLVVWHSVGWAQSLKQPQGVAFTPEGAKRAVSDTGNGRVLIFSFRSGGWHLSAAISDLNSPQKLVWLDNARIAVCESGKGQVTIFRLKQKRFERERTFTGFKRPIGLTIWRNLIFVADGETRKLTALTLDGKEVSSFRGNFNIPSDVAITDDGTVFLADDSGEIKVCRFD
ncbi:MAG: hypothetical protein ACK40X_04565, partial [Armatimonadota bacterium]